jgi:hypothetical protein
LALLRTIAQHKLLAMRAILTGWVVLFFLSYAVERPLLALGYRWIGGSLSATVSAMLDCLALAAAGWAVARLHRPWQTAMLMIFTFSLAPFDVGNYTGQTMALNFPWLLKLAWNLAGDSRYFTGFLASLFTNGLLVACLWTGGRAGGPPETRKETLFAPVERG